MIKLYTTDCPKCKVLEAKLKEKNIDYEVCKDEEEMIKKGFLSAPILVVNEEEMVFKEAVNWVNEQ